MRKGSMMSDFPIFIASMIIVLLLMSTAFGGKIMNEALFILYATERGHILEETVTSLSVAAYSQEDIEIPVRVKGEHSFVFKKEKDGYCFMQVDDANNKMTFPCGNLKVIGYMGSTKKDQEEVLISKKFKDVLTFEIRGAIV